MSDDILAQVGLKASLYSIALYGTRASSWHFSGLCWQVCVWLSRWRGVCDGLLVRSLHWVPGCEVALGQLESFGLHAAE